MDLSEANYKLYLIKEVERSSTQSFEKIYREVCAFINSQDYTQAYEKWVFVMQRNSRRHDLRIKSMKEILQGCFSHVQS